MKSAIDYAQFFLTKNLDDSPNTFDGNMKIQKLLFFSNLISIAEEKELLFEEDMYAFKNGTVVEEVRKNYKNDYYDLKKQADLQAFNFDENETNIINKTINIFGSLSAKELSDLNHEFDFWKNKYNNSKGEGGYYHKSKSIITKDEIENEIYKVVKILDAYDKNHSLEKVESKELINGITFYYDPEEIEDLNQFVDELEKFTNEADEKSYHVYFDEEEMVIL